MSCTQPNSTSAPTRSASLQPYRQSAVLQVWASLPSWCPRWCPSTTTSSSPTASTTCSHPSSFRCPGPPAPARLTPFATARLQVFVLACLQHPACVDMLTLLSPLLVAFFPVSCNTSGVLVANRTCASADVITAPGQSPSEHYWK